MEVDQPQSDAGSQEKKESDNKQGDGAVAANGVDNGESEERKTAVRLCKTGMSI